MTKEIQLLLKALEEATALLKQQADVLNRVAKQRDDAIALAKKAIDRLDKAGS